MSHILYDKLIEYGKNGKYPFHMPGHKRNDSMLSGMDPFDIDITEIVDFDNPVSYTHLTLPTKLEV